MENTFYVTGCRFHVREKDRLLIRGHFRENEIGNNRLLIKIDKKEMGYFTEERRLAAPCVKDIDGKKITKEYFLWIQLPENWKMCRKIRIYNCSARERKLVLTIPREKLLSYEKKIPKSIDTYTVCQDGCKLTGWYFNGGGTTLHFENMDGSLLAPEVKYETRSDVLREYPEVKCEEIVGFSAVYNGVCPKQLRVCFQAADKEQDEVVRLIETTAEKRLAYAKELVSKARLYFRQFGIRATLKRVGEKLTQEREVTEYEKWMKLHQPSKEMLRKQRTQKCAYNPRFSIVIARNQGFNRYLKETMSSIQRQTYANWEICQTSAKGDYILVIDEGDLLSPDALYECVQALNQEPETEMIYSDEDKITMDGEHYFEPHFKSDFNVDMLRSTNYMGNLLVIKNSLCNKVGDGEWNYDFLLRCVEHAMHIKHIAKVLYHKRVKPDTIVTENKDALKEAEMKALREHYARVGICASVMPTTRPGVYRSKYELKERPLVSVIIPNKDHTDDLEKCICSLEKVNTYKNMEYIIVENNSQEEGTFAYYQSLKKRYEKCKVLYWQGKGFNYPAINEFGIRHARGEYLLLLNNDTEILNEECIEELLAYCMRKDVGAVGARLFYEDRTIQHAGVIVGLGGVAGHAFVGETFDSPGYFGRAMMAQNLSAVTAACMMLRKSVYDEVGGLDPAFAVAFNDVDLCMKIRKAGYLIVYNPQAMLMHYESKSRGYDDTEEKIRRFSSEIQLFQERWADFLEQGDPYYNPNLALNRHDFALRQR